MLVRPPPPPPPAWPPPWPAVTPLPHCFHTIATLLSHHCHTSSRAPVTHPLRTRYTPIATVDHLFSRKRSFRKHIKRYGETAPVGWKEITEQGKGKALR